MSIICNEEMYGSNWAVSLDIEARTLVQLLINNLPADNTDVAEAHRRFDACVERLNNVFAKAREAQYRFPSWDWLSDEERGKSNGIYFSVRDAKLTLEDICCSLFDVRGDADKMAASLNQAVSMLDAAIMEVEESLAY